MHGSFRTTSAGTLIRSDMAMPFAPFGQAASIASPASFNFADDRVRYIHFVVPGLGLDLSPWLAFVAGLLFDFVFAITDAVDTTGRSFARHFKNISSSVGGFQKRILDLLVVIPSIILLAPVMLIVGLVVRFSIGSPAIFAHTRVGYKGTPFKCLKFRTMVVNGDEVLRKHLAEHPEAAEEWAETRKLRDDPRVTPLGRFLRKTSLDELPQLFNVLAGDMSCIGPRPIVTDELPRYGKKQDRYLKTRPGITGLWQISGRSSTSYKRRVALDTLYVRRWSLWRDIAIGILTIPAVLSTKDSA